MAGENHGLAHFIAGFQDFQGGAVRKARFADDGNDFIACCGIHQIHAILYDPHFPAFSLEKHRQCIAYADIRFIKQQDSASAFHFDGTIP